MPDDATPDLFGTVHPPAADAQALKPTASKAKASPLQREFDRLVGRIESAQTLLAAWQQQPTAILAKYHAKMAPAIRDLTDAQIALIVQIDALLTSPPKGLRITARRRDALSKCLLDLLDAAMSHGTDDTLTAIHDRYSDQPLQQIEQEEEAEVEAEIVAVFERFFGKGSIRRESDETHEAFVTRVQARLLDAMEADQRREEAARQRRDEKRAAKQEAKRRAKAPAEVEADQTTIEPLKPDILRTLYRKLASSLHPDRESDAAEKTRKTEAMQGINAAYQNKDLLSLLKLHNQTLRSDDTATTALAEDTLREYNALLKTQLKSLESQIMRTIDEVTPPGTAMTHGRIKRPEQLERLMDLDIENVKDTADSIREAIRDLNDPKLRTQAVNKLVAMTEERRELDEFDMMLDDLLGR